MKQPTLADLYFDDEFISTSGVVQGLMSGAKDGDQSYVIDKHNDGTESVYYTTESGTRYFLGVRNPEDIQLAAGPSPVVSDAGAAFGVYPSMGKRTQKSDIGEKMILGLPDLAAGSVKGLISGSVGGTGDILAIGRGLYEIGRRGGDQSVLDAFLHGMEQGFILPTSNDVDKWLTKQFGPVVPAGTSAFGLTPEERQTAATVGRITGEIVANPFTVLKAAPMVGKGIAKGAEYLGPKAAELAQQGIEKTMAPMMPRIVEPGPSMGDAAKAAAPVSDIGFYSAVEKAASGLQRKSGTGQSFLNDISKGENVKADEIKWMGLDDFLRDKKNVTKQEVQDYIAQNRVDVQEVQLGGAQPYDKNRLAQLESEYKTLEQHPVDDPAFGEEKYDEMIRLMNIRDQSTTQSLYDAAEQATRSAQRAQRQGNKTTAEKYFREAEFLNTRAEKLDLQGQGMSNPPKFGQYTLPGGENYREILLTMPLKEPAMPKGYKVTPIEYDDGTIKYFAETPTTRSSAYKSEADAQAELQRMATSLKGFRENLTAYKSSHWEQPNVLAHIRVNDRVDADGKKMLLIEEVQSDWHQAGREKGYIGNYAKDDVKPYTKEQAKAEFGIDNADLFWYFNVPDNTLQIPKSRFATQDEAMNYVLTEKKVNAGGVPDAPFKDTWYQLALKRAMKYAADNGYDRVGLTTGARQAERYDLSKQVDELLYKQNPDGTFQLSAQAGGRGNMIGEAIPKEKLADYVGKDVAKSIVDGSGKDINLGGPGSYSQPKDMWKSMSGIDLQVGGEGMKKYYDEIYPKFLEKYGKKWGAQVGETTVETQKSTIERRGVRLRKVPGKDEPIRYIDITPEMRASTSKGQPLFTATGVGAGTAGATMDDRKQQGRGAE